MDLALHPVTEAGVRFTKLIEDLAPAFAARAAQHDRDGTFPSENFAELRAAGLLSACVPERFGGMGLESLHDLTVGINRLGRADAATAIASQMHIAAGWQFARAWRNAMAVGDPRLAEIEALLSWYATGGIVLCVAGTEPGAAHGFPLTTAERCPDGWRVHGRKCFATNSTIADLFVVYVRIPAGGGDRIGLAFVTRETPGVEVQHNWDALGMRASGSNDVTFDCVVGEPMVMEVGSWGALDRFWLTYYTAGNIALLGAFLGCAEAARDVVVEMARTRRRAPGMRLVAERPAVQNAVAGIEIALAACRAMLARTCLVADELFAERLTDDSDLGELHQLMQLFVCTKQFVNRQAIDAVDLALTASGGAGYLAASPLSRLYRDVRAGPFMQPYSPLEAGEYIGKVALGLDPVVDH
jgi:alkylation response protein AidB-like acyl-CoA dehydrogenase